MVDTIEKYKTKIMGLNDKEKRVLNIAFKIFKQVYGDSEGFDLIKILYADSKEAIEIAKSLLKKGMSIDDISETTKLTVKEIEALNEEI